MSVTSSQKFNDQEMQQLVNVARQAIHDYFNGKNQLPTHSDFAKHLTQPGACFVTLEVKHQLQGCLGSIVPQTSLVDDVYNKARSAACQDHRFKPLQPYQLDDLTIEVSVLSPLERLNIEYEEELLEYLQDYKVGVILDDGGHRAVFLPQVWEQLSKPKEFIRHLKVKGGWPEFYWSDAIHVDVFTVTCAKEPFTS